MSHHAAWFRRCRLLAAVVGAGCTSAPVPGGHPRNFAARLEPLPAPETARRLAADALDEADAGSPRVRLFVPLATHRRDYIEAAVRLTDDAYVLVVAVDRDRRVQVIYPESPNDGGVPTKRGSTRLNPFFVGYGSSATAAARNELSRQPLSLYGSSIVLLAIASARPLQLQRLADQDGDWDEHQLEQLVFDQTPPGAATSLARRVLADGQEYDTDLITFRGRASPAK